MRKSLIVWVVVITLFSCWISACSKRLEVRPMLGPEEFAILPWGYTPGDLKVLKEIRECGFNLAGFVSPEYLDLVSEAGLKSIVIEGSTKVNNAAAQLDKEEVGGRVEALVKRVGKHEAVFGYYLRDEPEAGLYPGLKKWVASYRRAAPEALAYINLFPNYASPGQMNVATYEEYLESYVKTVEPSFISYDHYALMDNGSLRDGYFKNLETVRAAAQRHNLPFWNIVLANAHFSYAEPTAAGLRFQLYTSLAYGARGISYYTYFTPDIGNYRLGPIDKFGNKTPTWDMLRNVNMQLHRLGKVYVQLKSINVFHYPDVPDGSSGIQTSRLIGRVRGDNLLIGEFEGPDEQPFIMVVNKNLEHSTAFDIEFNEPGKIQHVNAFTGEIEPWQGENGRLAAGQGMLLCLKK